MPLRDAAYCRITRHLSDQVGIHRDHGGAQAKACTSARGFTTRVTGPDHNHVKVL
jgi:hypothetical protein